MKNELENHLKVIRKQQAQIAKAMEPFRAQQAQMAKVMEPFRAQQTQMAKFMEPFRAQQAQIAKVMEPFREQQAQINKLLKPLGEHLLSSSFDSIELNQDGSISFEGSIVEADTLNDCINVITIESDAGDYTSDSFVKWFNSLSYILKTVVACLLMPYCLSIFANLTTPIYEDWYQEITMTDQRSAKREVIKEANRLYDFTELKDYSFVIASVLHVREFGNKQSEIIDELYLGKTVKVVNKLKRWTLVEFFDKNAGEIKQGWVFSRYLEKFTK